MRILIMSVLGLAWSTAAVADPQPPTEAEIEQLAERCLRERRWDEAIAAFAKSRTCLPGSFAIASGDPRSRVVEQAIARILHDLDARQALASERAPYWDFYVRNFPFFSTTLDRISDYPPEPWATYAQSLAEARLTEADPAGKEPRFALCRRLAAIPRTAGPDPILNLIEDSWPAEHEDFGVCAARAFRALDEMVCDRSVEDGVRERARKAYAGRFHASIWFGLAALRWRIPVDASAAAVDGTARRWLGLVEWRDALDEEEKAQAAVAALVPVSAPWLTQRQAEAWLAVHAVEAGFERGGLTEGALERLMTWVEHNAGTPEARAARAHAVFLLDLYAWQSEADLAGPCRREWRRNDPEDPLLPWGVAHALDLAVRERDLTDAERGELEALAAGHRSEAIWLCTQSALARDDCLRHQGDRALARYREMAQFDPRQTRLPAADSADNYVDDAVEHLIVYAELRDPANLPALLKRRGARGLSGLISVSCGNALKAWAQQEEDRSVALRMRAGDVDGALQIYWERATGLPSWAETDAPAVVAYADLCRRTGRRKDLDALPGRIESARDELKPNDQRRWVRDYQAKLARTYLEDLRLVESGDLNTVQAKLAQLLGDLKGDEVWLRDEVQVLIHVLRGTPELRGAAARRAARPMTPAAIVWATVAADDASVDRMLDALVVPIPSSEREYGFGGEPLHYMIRYMLTLMPEEAYRAMIRDLAKRGMNVHDSYESVVARFPFDACWRGLRGAKGESKELAAWLAERRERLRRYDPWRAYCLGEE